MRDDYFALAERIRQRAVSGEEIVQWGMINDETLAKFPRLQRLMARLSNPALQRPGSRLEFYERNDGELGLLGGVASRREHGLSAATPARGGRAFP